MKYLFTPEGEAALARAMARRPLLAFDFDGTLAPIVALPDDARVSIGAARRLRRLGQRLPLAVITGRSVDDVVPRLDFEPRYIVGSHGAEDPAAGERLVRPDMLDGARAKLRSRSDELAAAGVMMEDKGFSIALHYRLARDAQRAQAVISDVLAGLGQGVDIFGGKLVVNLVPAEAPDKAATLESIVARSGASSAFFVGDDINDEPVFARRNPDWFTVRVGRSQPHSQAMFCIGEAGEMVMLLDRMLALLDPS